MLPLKSPRAKSPQGGPEKAVELGGLGVASSQRPAAYEAWKGNDRALDELRSEVRSVALNVAKLLASVEDVKTLCRPVGGVMAPTQSGMVSRMPSEKPAKTEISSTSQAVAGASSPVLRQTHTSTSLSESHHSTGTWPETVELREELAELKLAPSLSKSSKDMLISKRSQSALSEFDEAKIAGENEPSTALSFCCCQPLRPSSPVYISFQLMSVVVLLWDAVSIPFTLAWSIDRTDLLNAGGWFSTMFWTMDVCFSFVVGFYHDGEVILRFRSIAANYCRGWFLPDIIVVSVDWIAIALGDDSGKTVKLFRIVKLARFLRILAVLRLARLWRVVEDMMHNLMSENNRVIIHIMWLCSMVLLLNHLIACLWFAIGKSAHSDTKVRWTDLEWQRGDQGGSSALLDMPLEFQYTTAFHWAIAQITLGANEINSTNTSERIMQITCLLLGLVCGSSFISSLSAAIFEYHAAREDKKRVLRNLRRFLRQHNVNSKTAFAVQRMVNARISKAEVVHEEDVGALNLLRPEMRAELDFVIHKASVLSYPLFSIWVRMDMKSVWHLCGSGTTLHMLADEELFDSGRPAESLYYFIRGSMLYTQEIDRVIEDLSHETRVEDGAWLCEAAIWTHWQHVGAADCLALSEIWEIKVQAILKTLAQYPGVQQLTVEYGRQMHARIRAARPPLHSYPSDLHIPVGDFQEVIFTLSKDIRVALSILVLSQFSDQMQMRYDVMAGKVLLAQHGDWLAVLSATISCKIYTDDSRQRVLMELARSTGTGSFDVAAHLPVFEREFGETGDDRLERALSNELYSIKSAITWTHCRRRSEESEAKGDLCMLTLRTIYEGVLEHEPELPVLTLEIDETEQHPRQRSFVQPQAGTITNTFGMKLFTSTRGFSSKGAKQVLLDEEMRLYVHISYQLDESSPGGYGSRSVILYTSLSQVQADAINTEKHLQQLLEEKLEELQVFDSLDLPPHPHDGTNGTAVPFEESECMDV